MKQILYKIVIILFFGLFFQSCVSSGDQAGTTTPQNSAEFEIISQARNTGALIGTTVGATAGAIIAKHNRLLGGLIGGAVGALAGGLAGQLVGKQQLYNYRNIKLENEKLNSLLNEARRYNSDVEKFNAGLKRQIQGLTCETLPERERIARLKKQEAEEYRKGIQIRIEERTKLSKTLIEDQKKDYKAEIEMLMQEEKKLDQTIIELSRIANDPAVIG